MATPMTTVLTHIRGIIIAVPWFLSLLVADIIFTSLLPLVPVTPDIVYGISSAVVRFEWKWIQAIFEVVNGAEISVSGDTVPDGESGLVIANHVCWSDFYMIQAVAIRSGMISRLRYFAKVQLLWVPLLGWGFWSLGMPLVSRDWVKDKAEMDRVFSGIVKRRWPTWLVSFSEATRFTPKKYEESKRWCMENNRPQPKHALYPRNKGFVTTVQRLRHAPHMKAVYDLTIAYQHHGKFFEAPTWWDSVSLPGLTRKQGYRFYVHVRRFPMEDLPAQDDELAKWLEKVWIEKGDWLDRMKDECEAQWIRGQTSQ
ncbi:probable 1-acyl-sn-glycerol-3-phosphate acyltransferase delta [Cephalotrichum gorgonifer]|uniref:Probable 1-acyl-sn-glycerol-3-phosphate acyltransferase delta n=1 Tax=Cephalotrichum gorgonifer TaxID=2041049 RepID=A0AAE8MP51_9PEZI|nr:probable 1-acyl-sn-glycerol-3-phosphate acyltransferase delta [Cephalotrichum gorgonifer]